MRTIALETAALRPSRVRKRAKEVAREQARSARAWKRALASSSLAAPPDFLVIGGMRCGTTSLFHHLAAHPQITPALGKELNYFTLHYGNGVRWYRGHFPRREDGHLSFEASPYYLFYPSAPLRVAETLPDVKLIVLLRNPVDRAYSHYLHTRRRGFEPLSFAAALDAEADRLRSPKAGSDSSQDPVRLYSYTSRGMYAEQLEGWLDFFPREQVHVIRSEDLFNKPAAALDRLAEFLGITPVGGTFQRYAAALKEPSPQLTPVLRQHLAERFAPYNDRLAKLLGWADAWAADHLQSEEPIAG